MERIDRERMADMRHRDAARRHARSSTDPNRSPRRDCRISSGRIRFAPATFSAARSKSSSGARRRAIRRSASCAGAGDCTTRTRRRCSTSKRRASSAWLELHRPRVDDIARHPRHRRDDARRPRRRQLREQRDEASARSSRRASPARRRFRSGASTISTNSPRTRFASPANHAVRVGERHARDRSRTPS